MPSLGLMERVPLPSLRNYVIGSLVAMASCLFFSWSNSKDYMLEALDSSKNMTENELDLLYSTLTYQEYVQCLTLAITSQLWTICALINMCYCCLALCGKVIQLTIFGDLRVSEVQQLKERFWNFAFYKFIFIFGVLNVQYMNEAFMWIAWFSLLCSLQMFAHLCKFRFEYLSCSPATPRSQHINLICLLTLIFLSSIGLIAASVVTGLYTDWSVCGFMMAECLLLLVRTTYVLIKYVIYLVDISHEGLWETRGTITYYTELVCEISMHVVDLIHHLHMVIWSNIFLSMASIVIWMQVRYLFSEIQKRVSRHRNYLAIVKSMEERFTVATDEEIKQYDDNCAICWDKMQKARKLPCGHMFHNPCLRSWLAQDISCPTCRVSLSVEKIDEPSAPAAINVEVGSGTAHRAVERAAGNEGVRLNRTNLFHFDASRYISWLPSFSVEVMHTQINEGQPQQTSQLDSMAEEVQNMFPGLPLTSILEDLRSTHSVEITVDNILEGRLVILSNSVNEVSSDDSDSEDQYSTFEGYGRDSSQEQLLQPGHLATPNIPPHSHNSLLTDRQLHHRRTGPLPANRHCRELNIPSGSRSQDPADNGNKSM